MLNEGVQFKCNGAGTSFYCSYRKHIHGVAYFFSILRNLLFIQSVNNNIDLVCLQFFVVLYVSTGDCFQMDVNTQEITILCYEYSGMMIFL
jgi:type III secretory pathway component EscR